MSEEVMRWFYCSFAGREGFRGAIHIDAVDKSAVQDRANTLGINPGGQMIIIEMPDDIVEKVLAHGYERRLLSAADLIALDPLLSGEGGLGPKAMKDLTFEETANVVSNVTGVVCAEHNKPEQN